MLRISTVVAATTSPALLQGCFSKKDNKADADPGKAAAKKHNTEETPPEEITEQQRLENLAKKERRNGQPFLGPAPGRNNDKSSGKGGTDGKGTDPDGQGEPTRSEYCQSVFDFPSESEAYKRHESALCAVYDASGKDTEKGAKAMEILDNFKADLNADGASVPHLKTELPNLAAKIDEAVAEEEELMGAYVDAFSKPDGEWAAAVDNLADPMDYLKPFFQLRDTLDGWRKIKAECGTAEGEAWATPEMRVEAEAKIAELTALEQIPDVEGYVEQFDNARSTLNNRRLQYRATTDFINSYEEMRSAVPQALREAYDAAVQKNKDAGLQSELDEAIKTPEYRVKCFEIRDRAKANLGDFHKVVRYVRGLTEIVAEKNIVPAEEAADAKNAREKRARDAQALIVELESLTEIPAQVLTDKVEEFIPIMPDFSPVEGDSEVKAQLRSKLWHMFDIAAMKEELPKLHSEINKNLPGLHAMAVETKAYIDEAKDEDFTEEGAEAIREKVKAKGFNVDNVRQLCTFRELMGGWKMLATSSFEDEKSQAEAQIAKIKALKALPGVDAAKAMGEEWTAAIAAHNSRAAA